MVTFKLYKKLRTTNSKTMTQNRAISPQMYPNSRILSQDEFEKLKRQIQLLRIAHLRFIVQKYKFPANGNKTRLIQLVLHLLDALRNTPVLSNLNDDVLRMISNLSEPFYELNPVRKITVQPPPELSDLVFETPSNILIQYPETIGPDNSSFPHSPILGPLFVPPGASSGKFTFSIERLLSQPLSENPDANSNPLKYRVCIDFAWSDRVAKSFDLDATLNGIPLRIYEIDPVPMPLDITDILQRKTTISSASIEFKAVRTQHPMAIIIRPYNFQTVKSIVANLIHSDEAALPADWQSQNITAKGNTCQHDESFLLIPFLTNAIVRNRFVCPFCKAPLTLDDITVQINIT